MALVSPSKVLSAHLTGPTFWYLNYYSISKRRSYGQAASWYLACQDSGTDDSDIPAPRDTAMQSNGYPPRLMYF